METKLKAFNKIEFPQNSDHVSSRAKHLIHSLLSKSISGRYVPSKALSHPWITRKVNEKLPLTSNQRLEIDSRTYAIEEKLRKAINVLLFCSIAKNQISSGESASTKEDSVNSLDSYKQVLFSQ